MRRLIQYAAILGTFILCICFIFYIVKSDMYLATVLSDYDGAMTDEVLVSDKGEKVFHTHSNCQDLRVYYISLEAKDAIQLGYEPCEKCCELKDED